MREYLNIGSTPCDEECAQVGSHGYDQRARKECRAYLNQLQRLFPNASLGIKSFPHDFGSYYEVVAYIEEGDAGKFAFEVESNTPTTWDDAAREELGL